MTQDYAGRSHDEAMAARHKQKQKAQEQAGGKMAIDGTEAATRSIVAVNSPNEESRFGEVEAGSTVVGRSSRK
jgi:hypothetical protein